MADHADPAGRSTSAIDDLDPDAAAPADVTDDVPAEQLGDDAASEPGDDGADGGDTSAADEDASAAGSAEAAIADERAPAKRKPKAAAVPRPLPPGRFDAYSQRAARAGRPEANEGGDLFFPVLERVSRPLTMPPDGVAFAICSASASLLAVEMVILSLHRTYRRMTAPVIVVTEAPLSETTKRRIWRAHKNIIFVAPPEGWAARYPALSDPEEVGHLLGLWALSLAEHDRLVILQPDVLVLGDVRELWEGAGAVVGYDVNDQGFVPRNLETDSYLFGGNLVSLPATMRGDEAAAEMEGIAAEEAARSEQFDRFAIQRAWNLFVKDRERTVLPLRCYVSSIYLLKCLDGSSRGVCLLHDKGEDPWRARVERKA